MNGTQPDLDAHVPIHDTLRQEAVKQATVMADDLEKERNFSFFLKTGAAGWLSGSYTGKHEDGASRDWARRADASGRDVAGAPSSIDGSRRRAGTGQSRITR